MTHTNDLPDGIYLDLSFEDYLALPRISSSNLSDMMEGPSAFWANSPMNPDREEREETEAMKLGRAYHCARLEPHVFEDLYVQEFDLDDMPEGSLLKDTDYKAWLKDAEQAQTKAGETVLERAQRIEQLGGPETWHVSLDNWQQENAGLTWISRKHMAEIRRDAARIRMNPELEALISDGAAEVSILWTDEETGLSCKCRPDYLGPDWITHLKTWDMKSAGKPGNRAVVDAFRFNGYYRTGWFYLMGLHAIKAQELRLRHGTAAEDKPAGRVRKALELPEATQRLVYTWQNRDFFHHWFLFVRRAGIPDIRAREVMYFKLPAGVEEQKIGASTDAFARGRSFLAAKASLEVSECLKQILTCQEIYGTAGEPWFPRDMMGKIEDDDFSSYWLDSTEDPR